MPHNKPEREQEVRDKYEFVVLGGEYHYGHLLLGAADAIITGGKFTYAFLKDEVTKFGIDLAIDMAGAGLDPLTETLYFSTFPFDIWEEPFPGVRVKIVTKIVPYVAARKKFMAPLLIHYGWQEMPGAAIDIGIGADGTVCVIGNDPIGNDFGIYRWDGITFNNLGGGGVRIAVEPNGNPWIVNSAGSIYRHDGATFIQVPGGAKDIGIGANGTVCVIGGDDGIYRYDGATFNSLGGGGVRIAVEPNGNPWIVNSAGSIYRYDGNTFNQVAGAANDIGIGADGSVWVVGADVAGEGFGIYRFDGATFNKVGGAASVISVGPNGLPWVVNSAQKIHRLHRA